MFFSKLVSLWRISSQNGSFCSSKFFSNIFLINRQIGSTDDDYYYYEDYSQEYYQDYPLYRWTFSQWDKTEILCKTPASPFKLLFPEYFVSVYPSTQLFWTLGNFVAFFAPVLTNCKHTSMWQQKTKQKNGPGKFIAAQGSNKINWRKKGNEQLSKVVEVVVNVFKHLSLTWRLLH